MFIGREKELSILDGLYRSDHFEFVVLYGRRRVGKTALLSRFMQGKKAIYCMGVESSEKQNLENLSQSIMECVTGYTMDSQFSSFQAALDYVFQLSEKERIILAIDEYPYMARAEKSLASTLQRLIDHYKDRSHLMLILCGSSMSYMEDQVLAYKAPLYGRRTAQIRLLPFDFKTVRQYFPGFAPEDQAMIYGMAGGTPQYLEQMNDRLSIEENCKRTFLNPASFLFEEPGNLMKQEVREPALYNAILTAIAGGASRMAEISSKTGETNASCASYLKNLISLGIVKKETPYGEKESRRSIYELEDNLFRFWYRFIPENQSIIARGALQIAWQRIQPFLSEYMGKIFEEISIQYLWERLLAGQSPVRFHSLGRWWGNDPRYKKQTEIDIMGEENKETALFGECKWTNEAVNTGVLDTLTDRSRLFPYSHVRLYLFSRSGFTDGCRDKAESMGNVELVSYEDMLQFFDRV